MGLMGEGGWDRLNTTQRIVDYDDDDDDVERVQQAYTVHTVHKHTLLHHIISYFIVY